MKNKIYKNGIVTFILILVALALGVVSAVMLYFYLMIFSAFFVPSILIFFNKANKLLSGMIGVVLFVYYEIELFLRLPAFDFYFGYYNPVNENSLYETGLLGIDNLVYINILNYIGLGISLFMIYIFIADKRFRKWN